MKKNIIILVLAIAGCTSAPRSENPEEWTEEQVAAWFNDKEWLGESRLQPDPSINKRKLAIEVHEHKDRWDAAFEFMREGDLSLPVGDHPLDGQNAFVRVVEYDSKNPEDVFFEAHRNYADIQFVVTGEELIGVSDLKEATVKDVYNEENDIEFYNSPDGRNLHAKPGTFFIFFPGEGHRPAIRSGESVPVRKMVIKVRD